MDKNKLQPDFEKLSLADVSHGMLLNTDLNKAYCTCGKCGQVAEVDTSMVLTSNPPKYNYYCPHCGQHGYVYCSEVFYDTKVAPISSLKDTPTEICVATSCLICGESVNVSLFDNHSKICEKCRKAVLKLRKMLEED